MEYNFLDIASGAGGMWALQTFLWPFLKSWILKLLKRAIDAVEAVEIKKPV